MRPFLLAVMGQTGSGKSELAELIAEETGARLINADAFQVYRGFDIGTNKPSDRAIYDLLDVVDPDGSFGLGQWIHLATAKLHELWKENRSAVVVGGTGLYIRALMDGYSEMFTEPEPEVRAELMDRESRFGLKSLVEELLELDPNTKVDLSNPVRVRRALERKKCSKEPLEVVLPDFQKFKVATQPNMGSFEEGLKSRVQKMLSNGWPEEVESLLKKGVPVTSPGFRAIGYQSLAGYVRGETDLQQTELDIVTRTRQYAKRQRTWLRSERNLHVLPGTAKSDEGPQKALESAIRFILSRGD